MFFLKHGVYTPDL